MSALGIARVTLRPPAARDLRLTAWQVRYELRSFRRNRARGVFTFVFPLVFLAIFASLDRGGRIGGRGGIAYDDFLIPGILAYSVITTTFVNMTVGTATLRDRGVLKRMQGTPLPRAAYIAARILTSGVIMLVIAAITIAAGGLLWGLHVRAEALPAIMVTLLLGGAAFTTLGIGLVRYVINAESAPVVVNVITLPLSFISDIWFPTDGLPAGLRHVASAFPIKSLANALQYAFDPRHHGLALDGSALLTLAAWTVVGVWLMARFLRTPLGDDPSS
jgi:ABC-2 type transport system permease protein